MALTKKIRFEVFKRDGFSCAYCGKCPPEAVLEVDHIEPKSKGGGDNIENLITACFDCNRGKRDIPLDKIPSQLSETLSILKEKESQLLEYRKFVKKINVRKKRDAKSIEKIFQEVYPDRVFTKKSNRSVIRFLDRLKKESVEESMDIALSRTDDYDRCFKYFCGVCWNKINNREQV